MWSTLHLLLTTTLAVIVLFQNRKYVVEPILNYVGELARRRLQPDSKSTEQEKP